MILTSVINVAILVREQYQQQAPDIYPLSIDFYLKVIAEYTGYKILLSTADDGCAWESDKIRGMINRFDEGRVARIIVAPTKKNDDDPNGVTFCEQRFIVVKEACHLLIDNEATYAASASSLIESLLFGSPPVSNMSNATEEHQSEIMAVIAALELLFPWDDRAGRKQKIEAGQLTYLDVAHEYKIPERHVFWVLRDNVHKILSKDHDLIDNIQNTKKR